MLARQSLIISTLSSKGSSSAPLMLSISHSKKDLDKLINAFEKTCIIIKKAALENNNFLKYLKCKPMSPVFKGLRERNAVSN